MSKKNQWKKKANQWKNAHGNRERQRRYAWARYFEETRRQHNLNYSMYENMKEVKIPAVSTYLSKEFARLYSDAKKRVECSICLDVIKCDDLELRVCGHIYHKSCWETYEGCQPEGQKITCPQCRQ